MSNECAIIIAALITVGGSVLTFVINLLLNNSARKFHLKQNFLYEIFKKRLSLYEDVSCWDKSLFKIDCSNPKNKRFISKNIADLENRCFLYGPQDLEDILDRLRKKYDKAFDGFDAYLDSIKAETEENQNKLITDYFLKFVEDDQLRLLCYVKKQPFSKEIDAIQAKILKKSLFEKIGDNIAHWRNKNAQKKNGKKEKHNTQRCSDRNS